MTDPAQQALAGARLALEERIAAMGRDTCVWSLEHLIDEVSVETTDDRDAAARIAAALRREHGFAA